MTEVGTLAQVFKFYPSTTQFVELPSLNVHPVIASRENPQQGCPPERPTATLGQINNKLSLTTASCDQGELWE